MHVVKDEVLPETKASEVLDLFCLLRGFLE